MKPLYLTLAAAGSVGLVWAVWNKAHLPEVCAPSHDIYFNCYQSAMQKLGEDKYFHENSWIKRVVNSYKVSEICHSEFKKFSDCMNYPPYFMITAICSALAVYAIFKLVRP